MGRGKIHEVAQSTVLLNGTQADQEMQKLTKDAEKFAQKKREAFEKNDMTAYNKWDKALKATNKSMKGLRQETNTVEAVLKNLNGVSLDELGKAVSKARKELNALKQSDPGYAKKAADVKKLADKHDELSGKMKKVNVIGGGLKATLQNMLPIISIAAALATFKQLVTNIINVRKEFERYQAVLENSLGSQQAARQELGMLAKFAAETPFALTELTGAYVKLVNQGFKPGQSELRKMGDLASSVGKGFDQLSEAVIDAQVGEMERLKEFGIRAKKDGDLITFTFKGVSTEVKNTSADIQKYILSLGELEGVSGSMAKISATLGGRISNLGDSWDMLMNTMGSKSSGVFVWVINRMTDFVNMITNASKSVSDLKLEVMDDMAKASMQNAIKEIDVMSKSLIRNGVEEKKAQKRAIELYEESMRNTITSTTALYESATGEEKVQLEKRLGLMAQELSAVQNYYTEVDRLEKIRQEADKKQQREQVSPIQRMTIIKDLQVNPTKTDPLSELQMMMDEQKLVLKQQYADGKTSQEQYNMDLENMEVAHLLTMLTLRKKLGMDTMDIENKLLDIRISNQKKAEAEQIASQERIMQAYGQFINTASNAIENYMAGNKDALKEGAISMINMALDMLKILTEMAIAGATIQSLTQPDSIATFGVSGLIRAGIIVGLIELAFGAVKGLVSSGLNNLYDGGYTSPGPWDKPQGVVHSNEFVANRYATNNPSVKPVLDIIDYAQQNGQISNLNLPAAVAASGSTQSMMSAGSSVSGNAELKRLMLKLEKYLTQPTKAYLVGNADYVREHEKITKKYS